VDEPIRLEHRYRQVELDEAVDVATFCGFVMGALGTGLIWLVLAVGVPLVGGLLR
jgi:hypothetical protein